VARVKHLSLRTEEAYVARIRQFIHNSPCSSQFS
jgi:hypothetical protein